MFGQDPDKAEKAVILQSEFSKSKAVQFRLDFVLGTTRLSIESETSQNCTNDGLNLFSESR